VKISKSNASQQWGIDAEQHALITLLAHIYQQEPLKNLIQQQQVPRTKIFQAQF
jgi:hypothetical protein